MSSNLGFWSVDPATGALRCCPKATDILGFSGSHPRMLRDVLLGVRLISVQKVTVRIASNGAGVPA